MHRLRVECRRKAPGLPTAVMGFDGTEGGETPREGPAEFRDERPRPIRVPGLAEEEELGEDWNALIGAWRDHASDAALVLESDRLEANVESLSALERLLGTE